MARRTIATGILLVALAFVPRHVGAATILGGQIIVQQDGDVIAEFLGDFAGFTSNLFLFSPANGLGTLFTNNGGSIAGEQINLGTYTAGTELIFGLFVNDTGNTFYTGAGALNPDQMPHAQVITDPLVDIPVMLALLPTWNPGETIVGFEDIFGGGDFDYNDLVYSFTNVAVQQVPEPVTMLLVGTGAVGLAVRNRRRKQATR
jgi:hypothetical protein